MIEARGVVAFDLDGTLVPNTTMSQHLAPWVGHHGIEELERLYAEGQITNAEIAERDATFYKNRRRRDVWHQLETLGFIDGVTETITWLKQRSLVPVIATVTLSVAADFVRDRYGFTAASGCELTETDDGVLLGTVARHFAAEDKVTFVESIAEGLGLGFKDVVAIGDSTSDIPLFHSWSLDRPQRDAQRTGSCRHPSRHSRPSRPDPHHQQALRQLPRGLTVLNARKPPVSRRLLYAREG